MSVHSDELIELKKMMNQEKINQNLTLDSLVRESNILLCADTKVHMLHNPFQVFFKIKYATQMVFVTKSADLLARLKLNIDSDIVLL